MNKTVLIIIIILLTGIVGATYFFGQETNTNNTGSDRQTNQSLEFGKGQKAIVYKSPSCGCCVDYLQELEKQRFETETIPTNDMNSIKEKYGIPADKQSCHTAVIGDYFIEGHVPMEAVKKLLAEKPNIDGIGLPRMPSGSPGMPGSKRAPFEVYQLVNGVFGEFLTL